MIYWLLALVVLVSILDSLYLRRINKRLVEALKSTNTSLNETREEVAKHKKQLRNL